MTSGGILAEIGDRDRIAATVVRCHEDPSRSRDRLHPSTITTARQTPRRKDADHVDPDDAHDDDHYDESGPDTGAQRAAEDRTT